MGTMADDDVRYGRVPSGRLARFGAFGRLAGSVAGGMAAEGVRRLAAGERPRAQDLILTPANVTRLADRLSHLRGAAMKLGQMVSMDAGEFLPPELAEIMARLRSNAHHLPPPQLDRVLRAEWGADWRRRFRHFQSHPIAAASIGQVHRATTRDGRTLAIKVQYPGVAGSIDADVDNVATLLRVSGLLPRELEIAPLLTEAKQQLKEEADYVREGAQLSRFADWLADDPDFIVPRLHADLTTPDVLAMDFVAGEPIEVLVGASQEARDTATERLITLTLRELFDFGAMQTDPNFANYRVQSNTGRIVLLDFGAARDVPGWVREAYHRLLMAGLDDDRTAVREAALAAGFVGEGAVQRHGDRIDAMIDLILAELHRPGPFDFADRGFLQVVREQGMAVAADRAAWHLPPADTLFVQRKISGTALLAARLEAKVDVRAVVARYRDWRLTTSHPTAASG
jgi:predicted unusual protein kinase regulating ubiquinone biosynthesis (AarF/ABC1/UbiB family)